MTENRIKKILQEQGGTVAELAASLGVSRQALSRQIGGAMTVDTAARIAAALGVELWQLFGDGRQIAAKYAGEGGGLRCPRCGARLGIHSEE